MRRLLERDTPWILLLVMAIMGLVLFGILR
jgi:hypothetical protein